MVGNKFFGFKLKSTASATYDVSSLGQRADVKTESVKLSSRMTELKREILNLFTYVGEQFYQSDSLDKTPFQKEFTQIEQLYGELRDTALKLASLKGKCLCEQCGKECDMGDAFCAKCGTALKY